MSIERAPSSQLRNLQRTQIGTKMSNRGNLLYAIFVTSSCFLQMKKLAYGKSLRSFNRDIKTFLRGQLFLRNNGVEGSSYNLAGIVDLSKSCSRHSDGSRVARVERLSDHNVSSKFIPIARKIRGRTCGVHNPIS